MTHKQIIEDYLAQLKVTNQISPLTMKTYRGELNLFFRAISLEPQDIEKKHILQYVSSLSGKDDKDGKNETGYSSSTIRKKVTILKEFFNFLEDQGTLEKNPFYRLKFRINNHHHREIKIITKEQQRKMLSPVERIEEMSFEQLREECIIRLFLATGIRRQELIDLEVGNVDLENRKITVRGKGNKIRSVPVDKETTAWLKHYLYDTDVKGNIIWKKHAYIVQNIFQEEGEPLQNSRLHRIVNRRLRKAGLKNKRIWLDKKTYKGKGVGCHIFRHTFATRLLEAGVPDRVIQVLLGHSSVVITQQIYQHPSEEFLKQHYDRVFENDAGI